MITASKIVIIMCDQVWPGEVRCDKVWLGEVRWGQVRSWTLAVGCLLLWVDVCIRGALWRSEKRIVTKNMDDSTKSRSRKIPLTNYHLGFYWSPVFWQGYCLGYSFTDRRHQTWYNIYNIYLTKLKTPDLCGFLYGMCFTQYKKCSFFLTYTHRSLRYTQEKNLCIFWIDG